MRKPGEFHGDDICLACGPGTGIDTKGGVKGVLHLPRGFYERLYIYVHSDRARKRRQMADGGDHPDQPLFLSHRGAPLYEDRASRGPLGTGPQGRRHVKTGQAVRQFIRDELLPMMPSKLQRVIKAQRATVGKLRSFDEASVEYRIEAQVLQRLLDAQEKLIKPEAA
jgi:hypothetical protein